MTSTITTLKHLQIPLEEVVEATNNFDEKYVIGGGGFGKVYRGQLLVSGEMVNVAARRLDPKHGQAGDVEFWTEISMLSSLKHENILSLIGFCDENGEKIIINKDEATKGSLSMYLSDPTTLTWIQRLNICVGVARALRYIHNGEGAGRGESVIHRNINSSTVLLDDNWEAKLSGFEYSIKQSVNRMDRVVLSEAIGTTGYMDPSIVKTGGVSHKSDIYSFGVVLCEIFCGRKAFIPDVAEDDRFEHQLHTYHFERGTSPFLSKDLYRYNRFVAPMFRYHYERGTPNYIIHPGLQNQVAWQSLISFSKAADSCLREDTAQRPNTNDIVIELEYALECQRKLENLRKNLEPLKIPLSDILLATDNFSEAYQIEDNGYYHLYRAELKHFDTESPCIKEEKNKGEQSSRRHNTVVIKRFVYSTQYDVVEEGFYTEIEVLNTCKHPNIVKLLGFCDEDSEMILVVEHLSKGYLSDYWNNINHMPIVTWVKRLKICLDVAHALNYLHTEMEDEMLIIHRDIRSDCIALDENWGAKIIDFGRSVSLSMNQDNNGFFVSPKGSISYYRDPEYWKSGWLKRESDVYSFGVLLFEVLSGKLADDPIYRKESDKFGLAFVVRRCFKEGTLMELLDPVLKEERGENKFSLKTGPNKDSLEKFVNIAHECMAETQYQRPTMKMVIKELEEALFFQEEQIQRSTVVQDVHEIDKPMHLSLIHENYRKKLEHLRIPLSDIKSFTDDFSEEYHIVDTGKYNLYKGEFVYFFEESPNSSIVIEPIPRGKSLFLSHTILPAPETYKGEPPGTAFIKRISTIDEYGITGFDTELQMLATCKHPNIIKLFGFCDEGSELILIIEHLPNGYLGDYWEDTNMRYSLTWTKRLKICLDVANALNYIHSEMEDQKMIIHRNIKSHKIMLDNSWRAKLVDFVVSVFLPLDQDDDALYHSYPIGTFCYIDPEYWETGKLKRESDVYSFGVVLFEVLCGKLADNPIYREESDEFGLAFVARRCFKEGTLMDMMDPVLMEERSVNNFSLKRGPNKDSLEKFVKIAHECIAETQDQRPTMKVVVKELQEALFFQENNKDEPIISFEVIKSATQNFHDKNCIGGGGFGKVYRGEVPQGDGFNTIVAKQLDTRLGQGEQQFRNELQILFEYKHENIIPLVGYCDEKNEQIIVYEYASQGSLDRYLKDAHLTWVKRLTICIDVATALAFLHGGSGKQAIVIHRDIKTANILLNDEWNAKLADFGLSLISPINQETDYVIDHACGTRGYLDPLYLESGFLTKESDIYSFGVVLFEILCGRSTFEIRKQKGQYLPGFIKESFEKGKHDDLVFDALKEQIVPKALTAFKTIAYECLYDDRERRPTAKEVLQKLEAARELQISGSD